MFRTLLDTRLSRHRLNGAPGLGCQQIYRKRRVYRASRALILGEAGGIVAKGGVATNSRGRKFRAPGSVGSTRVEGKIPELGVGSRTVGKGESDPLHHQLWIIPPLGRKNSQRKRKSTFSRGVRDFLCDVLATPRVPGKAGAVYIN